MRQVEADEAETSYKLLEKSINQKKFRFMYQPIVNMKSGGIGLEMLARLQHKGDWIPPMRFIPAIEKNRLITAFNKLLIDQLVADLHELKKKIQNVSFISLNLSPYIFIYNEERDFMNYLTKKLQEKDIQPYEVCLEITESSRLDLQAFSFLEEYKKKGFLIAIDDFGTGFSSMEYLIGNSFNVLKLDIGLIRQITTKPRKVAIVESVLMLSKKLNFRVIAEGVESKEQFDLLNKLGIDDIQGYFISKPLFLEDLFCQMNRINKVELN